MMLGLMSTMASAAVELDTVDALATGVNLSGTEVYFGEYNGSPIKWYVVATDSDTATPVDDHQHGERPLTGTTPMEMALSVIN